MSRATIGLTAQPRTRVRERLVTRQQDRSNLLAGVFGCVALTALGLMHGGYFETTWGWGSLLCLWLVMVTLLSSDQICIGSWDLCFLGGLALFLAFTAVSSWWSIAPAAPIRELERGVLIFSSVLAVTLLSPRRMRPVLGGVLAGIAIVACYGLMTRLFPTRFGTFDAIAGYRLADPLGYWNALGLFSAMGVLLALGFAARARTLYARGLGSSLPVLLCPVMYFTFGRGAWLALGVGLAAALAIDSRRLQLSFSVLATAPLPALAIWMCSRQPDLNRRTAGLADATAEGKRLAFILVALTVSATVVGPALQLAERKLDVGRGLRRAYGGALLVLTIGLTVLGIVSFGGPREVVSRAYGAFKAPPVSVSSSNALNGRLFSLSSNGRLDQWRVAIDDFRAHQWLGSGAGTYEYAWMTNRPVGRKVRDAHSLYVEVLAELGPIGLGLLLLTFAVPILAACRARRHPLAPIALGAYLAYAAHAGVDWDWEMPAVTIAGLLCGAAVLVAARSNANTRLINKPMRLVVATGTAALAAFAFVGLMGNLAIAASSNAASSRNWQESARRAQDAKQWMPWSSDPWRLEGEAQYVLHQDAAARVNFRKAASKDPNNWLVWADLATVSPHGAWRAPARRALELNPLAPELGDFRRALGVKG